MIFLTYNAEGFITGIHTGSQCGSTEPHIVVAEVPERVQTEYKIIDQQLVPFKSNPYDSMYYRMSAYRDVGQQLNLLYDDIQADVFGEAAKTGKFAAYIQQLKQQFPKN
jgi:hypothetical protein